MTEHEKRKKVAMMAASYYLLQESEDCKQTKKDHQSWLKIGKEMLMKNRTWIQSRGRFR